MAVKGKNLTQLDAMLKAATNNGIGTANENEWQDPKKATVSDLLTAIDWLLMNEWGDDSNDGSAYINVAELLGGEVLKMLKKEYAKKNNCKVSEVRIVEAK